MIVIAKLQSFGTAWDSLTPEQYAELRVAIPSLKPEKPKYDWDDHFCDYAALLKLAEFKIDVDLSPTALTKNTMLTKLAGKYKPDEAVHGMVQIHIPDVGLMLIDEVTYLEDCCTNLLQDQLNEGWRILAVCPPNAQRRPDYILGRRKNAKS